MVFVETFPDSWMKYIPPAKMRNNITLHSLISNSEEASPIINALDIAVEFPIFTCSEYYIWNGRL